jgi:hypothetical protein
MLVDFNLPTHLGDGIIVFPDWVGPPLPKQPSQVQETIILQGQTAGPGINLEGTVGASQFGSPQ